MQAPELYASVILPMKSESCEENILSDKALLAVVSVLSELVFYASDIAFSSLLRREFYASDIALLAEECVRSLLTEVVFYASDTALLAEECVRSLLTEVVFYASDISASSLLSWDY